jgi:signal transduction histidine kinase
LAAALALWICALVLAAATLRVRSQLPAVVPASAHPPSSDVLVSVIFSAATVGAFLVWRVPSNVVGWLLCGAGIDFALAGLLNFIDLGSGYGGDPSGTWRYFVVLGDGAWPLGIGLVAFYIPLFFPDGRLPSPRWRPLPVAAAVALAVVTLGNIIDPEALDLPERHIANPLGVSGAHGAANAAVTLAGIALIGCLLAGVASVVIRYRRGSEQLRHQLKWFVAAVVAVAASLLLSTLGLEWAGYLMAVSMALLPIAIAVAILRYRLYDIDVVINKALVYGALAVLIAAVYIAIVAGIGELVGSGTRPNVALSIVATAVVAIAFQPVRTRLQRLANRLVYGPRATPYEVMAQFSRRMSESLSVEGVLARMAEAAGRGVSASMSSVAVNLPGGTTRAASWPEEGNGEPQHRVRVTQQGEVLGEIGVTKPAGESLTSSDRSLLEHLAAQAAVLFSNLRLTLELEDRVEQVTMLARDLQESRHRIVTAADAERRRLESELREGTERQLEELERDIESARQSLRADSPAAAAGLQALISRATEILDGLREFARGIFPPLLADKGLAAALEAQSRRFPDVQLHVDPRLGGERFDPRAEASLYFVCINSVRGARHPRIELIRDQSGITCRIAGIDRQSVSAARDRIEAIGGTVDATGTELIVRVPAPALELVG